MRMQAALAVLAIGACLAPALGQARYFGKDLGALSELHHGVKGRVYAVDSRTLFIKDLHYDGEGPAAYFYVGSSKSPSASGGLRLRDERGGTGPLRRYRGEGVTLSLPDGKTLKDVKWFSIWCDEFSVNFGDVSIPRELDFPKPAKVGALRGVHGVSSDPVVVVDAQTLLVPNFSYDGEAPDAKFWVGRGDKPSPQGIRIPDENGKEAPLRKYDRKTIVLTLPGELTVFDIGHFAVWCEAFTVNFGHVTLPRNQLANVPPSLKMLGVSPQSKLNCEVLHDELAFEVRWAVAGDSIVLQLVGKLEDGEYMSFGISGDPSHSQMVGGDVAVAWVDKATLKGYAVDYYLDAKSQCAGVRGSCPDERLGEKTNSIRLLNAALVNGYSIVTYQRSLRAADELDRPVLTNGSQPVIWALGPLNSRNEVSYHHHFTKGDKFIEFGRAPVWNCPMPENEDEEKHEPPRREQHVPSRQQEENKAVIKPNPVPTPRPVPRVQPWDIPAIQCFEPPDGVFYAQMGPTGGKQGYSAITGHVGWGISWYINGLLIPEIYVVRGKKYTFVVEGGSNPEVPARYHPFYITNDPVGGYLHRNEEERKGIEIYAGVRRSRSGDFIPTGVGRLCNWTPDPNGPEADEYPSFGAYQRSLTLECEQGNPGIVTWTPDRDTPDTVYYQCFTHRHLGWKINVIDECDASEAEESRVVEHVVPADLTEEESVQVHSRVRPDSNFLDQRNKVEKIINTKTNYNDFSTSKGEVPTGSVREPVRSSHRPALEYELPVTTGQIEDVIQAVESIENMMKDEMRRNLTQPPKFTQYQVHEDVKDIFLPEQPFREDDEYIVESTKRPDFNLSPNQPPLTLQTVLRPNGPHKQMGPVRPPFRRPVPPEIKVRRPNYPKGNGGYPLQMPNLHGPNGMQKKPLTPKHPSNHPNYRPPNNMNRPLPPGIPPMKAMPPLMHHNKPVFNQHVKTGPVKANGAPIHSIILGKPGPSTIIQPSQSHEFMKTNVIANQIVKSQISLPSSNEPVIAHSSPSSFLNKPGQIILGKPMDYPQPLDQQMIQSNYQNYQASSTASPDQSYLNNFRLEAESAQQPQNEVKSSDFIGESVPDTSSLKPAVNTGFQPDTIVIESGFKPIIREPLMAGEDRIADPDENANRREDTDVEEEYDLSPQLLNHQYTPLPSDKLTETFEPMFIPSPPDHLLPTNDRTKEIFPKNHAKEDRPHPVYVKTQEELVDLFSKKNMDKEVPTDLVMASDRVSPHYLPPDPKMSMQHSQKLSMEKEPSTFTTYDGKKISASTLVTVPNITNGPKLYSSKLPSNTELLLKTPQFGPFKGEIPPLLSKPSASDLTKDQMPDSPEASDHRSTHLKLVNVFQDSDDSIDDLKEDGSEIHEVIEELTNTEDDEENEEENTSEITKRRKRDTSTQFIGEVEEKVMTNGHSINGSQEKSPTSFGSRSMSCWTHVVLLALCLRLV
ncbi:protein Skeletor, isoforms D/E isoform X1 [Amyelois transitella]|uniref:protein Skeletor, isoforms D/E isoform X1 n=1 Tax=Amyelois transitella TaxID=680683 RepID=UPI00298F8CB8|nr:protein Skeletor, isoforms D/E isoform X1 [Amyelois transitella]